MPKLIGRIQRNTKHPIGALAVGTELGGKVRSASGVPIATLEILGIVKPKGFVERLPQIFRGDDHPIDFELRGHRLLGGTWRFVFKRSPRDASAVIDISDRVRYLVREHTHIKGQIEIRPSDTRGLEGMCGVYDVEFIDGHGRTWTYIQCESIEIKPDVAT